MPFLLKDVAGIQLLTDQIHPNPSGNKIVAKNILIFKNKLLALKTHLKLNPIKKDSNK